MSAWGRTLARTKKSYRVPRRMLGTKPNTGRKPTMVVGSSGLESCSALPTGALWRCSVVPGSWLRDGNRGARTRADCVPKGHMKDGCLSTYSAESLFEAGFMTSGAGLAASRVQIDLRGRLPPSNGRCGTMLPRCTRRKTNRPQRTCSASGFRCLLPVAAS